MAKDEEPPVKRNMEAKGLSEGQFRPQTIPNKKRYDRKKAKPPQGDE